MARKVKKIDIMAIWDCELENAIDENKEFIDESIISIADLKDECISYLSDCYENEMLSDVNYENVVYDIAKANGAWKW